MFADGYPDLQVPGRPFIVPNVWYAVSARVSGTAGLMALATSATAWALDYADGELLDRDELFAAIERIARVVKVPLSANREKGFGSNTDENADTCDRVLANGVVGVNLKHYNFASGKFFPITTAGFHSRFCICG